MCIHRVEGATVQIQMNLVVLRCEDLEISRDFYTVIGLDMVEEKHGNGPKHYSCTLDGLIFEIYPLGKKTPTHSIRLGFVVESVFFTLQKLKISSTQQLQTPNGVVIRDPDGHTIELSNAQEKEEL